MLAAGNTNFYHLQSLHKYISTWAEHCISCVWLDVCVQHVQFVRCLYIRQPRSEQRQTLTLIYLIHIYISLYVSPLCAGSFYFILIFLLSSPFKILIALLFTFYINWEGCPATMKDKKWFCVMMEQKKKQKTKALNKYNCNKIVLYSMFEFEVVFIKLQYWIYCKHFLLFITLLRCFK